MEALEYNKKKQLPPKKPLRKKKPTQPAASQGEVTMEVD
jgi:hypothetical protein